MKNTFDVFKEMAEKNMDIRSAPLTNIIAVDIKGSNGEIRIGVNRETAQRLVDDMVLGKEFSFVGGLILADKNKFYELEAGGEPRSFAADDDPGINDKGEFQFRFPKYAPGDIPGVGEQFILEISEDWVIEAEVVDIVESSLACRVTKTIKEPL